MIISASRRTDIPAFFPTWFFNRARTGHCIVSNPVSGKPYRVSLQPDDVDAIVFWSKNPRPLLPYLAELQGMGYRYYFQFTLNDYPPGFEPGIPPLAERLDTFRELAARIGPERVVWRYDPIILSSATPPEWHRERFMALAKALKVSCRRVVVSVLDDYACARGRLFALAHKAGFSLDANRPRGRALPELLADLAQTARGAGLEIQSCAEDTLYVSGIPAGACIDAALINRLWGLNLDLRKDPGQRKGCLCAMSRDIGANNTCRHGCVYCYATRRKGLTADKIAQRPSRDGLASERNDDISDVPDIRAGGNI
jgi:hypothetical protein